MPDFAEPAVLERLIVWLRTSGVFFVVVGTLALVAAGYYASRLQGITARRAEQFQEQVQRLEAERVAKQSEQPVKPVGRLLSEPQHRTLVQQLEPFAGTRINVVSLPEFEPGSYAHAIIKTLRAAGLEVRVSYFPDNEAIAPGLTAYWLPEARERAQEILGVLESNGIILAAKRGAPKAAVLELHIGRDPITPPE